MLILTIVLLDITLEYFFFFSFYFVYTSACNLVFAFVRVITVSVCEDGVKLNYFRSILNQKEPYIDYTENKEKHIKEIWQPCRTMKSKIRAKRKTSRNGVRMGIMVGIMRPGRLYSQMIHLCF